MAQAHVATRLGDGLYLAGVLALLALGAHLPGALERVVAHLCEGKHYQHKRTKNSADYRDTRST